MKLRIYLIGAVLGCALLTGCASEGATLHTAQAETQQQAVPRYDDETLNNLRRGTRNNAWVSTYRPLPSTPTLIRNATIMTAAGDEREHTDLLMQDGKIVALGPNLDAPPGTEVIDGTGRFVTPGLIDSHSHLGVSPTPEVGAHFDNNDAGNTTPQLWIDHSIWPQGPGFARALAGGTTTALILPGSGDLIEGRGVPVKFVPARTPQEMIFPDAPHGIKMACGENPKRGGGYPNTRMGNVAGYRNAFIQAERYRAQWDEWLADPQGDPPARDLGKETMAEALRGNIFLQVHCYRADDITSMLQVTQEFDLKVRSFHHAVEAYKIRDYLAEHGAAASMWSDWWGFKMEAFDGIVENVALVSASGARAVVHSDSDLGIQLLNQDAAKALYAGRRAGLDISRDEALRWITANPAWVLGIDDRVGTLEVGKHADVVLWSGDPFSVYSWADQVWIDGALVHDRFNTTVQPVSDFELGILKPGGGQ
ncbi:MAG: amidohydrolase [Rhodothermales bacterium]